MTTWGISKYNTVHCKKILCKCLWKISKAIIHFLLNLWHGHFNDSYEKRLQILCVCTQRNDVFSLCLSVKMCMYITKKLTVNVKYWAVVGCVLRQINFDLAWKEWVKKPSKWTKLCFKNATFLIMIFALIL
jgi:hypothetical protein